MVLIILLVSFRLNRRHARAENQHGLYTDIAKEKEFMDITTSEKYVVGHFYHKDFRRCKIMDTHMEVSRIQRLIAIKMQTIFELFLEFGAKVLRYAFHQNRSTKCSIFSRETSNQSLALCYGLGEWICTDKVKLTNIKNNNITLIVVL